MAEDGEVQNFERLLSTLYKALFQRSPTDPETLRWTKTLKTTSVTDVIEMLCMSAEYVARHRIKPFFANGHYHSPVVDPGSVESYVAGRRNPGPTGFEGVCIDLSSMTRFWDTGIGSIGAKCFPEAKQDGRRFHFEGSPFPYGDAQSLHAIIGHFKPKRIVEIGSGFSTACMLDSTDIHGLADLDITCIDPNPERLRGLVTAADLLKLRLIPKTVQEVTVHDVVGELVANDILFNDSTHIMKTGSDVHYELFERIPAVRTGVIIHIHDCPYPFEYPNEWIAKNYSWNEVYAVRAFLMYNSSFEILFWGSLFRSVFPDKVRDEGGVFGKNPGTSIWLRRVE